MAILALWSPGLLQAGSIFTYLYNSPPHPPAAPMALLPCMLSVNVVGVLTALASVSNTIKWMPSLVNSWHTSRILSSRLGKV